MRIVTLNRKDILASNCYILIYEGKFSVVDPSLSYTEVSAYLPEICSLTPDSVLLTHGHIDHMWGIDTFVSKGCKVYVSGEDSKMLSDRHMNCSTFIIGDIKTYDGAFYAIEDGACLHFGDEVLTVKRTPGHTEGSVVYIGDGYAFTGDTLFADGLYGRTDVPSGDFQKLKCSLLELFKLDGSLLIYPGHGRRSTISETKSNLIF